MNWLTNLLTSLVGGKAQSTSAPGGDEIAQLLQLLGGKAQPITQQPLSKPPVASGTTGGGGLPFGLETVTNMLKNKFLFDPQTQRVLPSSPVYRLLEQQKQETVSPFSGLSREGKIGRMTEQATNNPFAGMTGTIADVGKPITSFEDTLRSWGDTERPWHQEILETAANNKDWESVRRILNNIPFSDPYKISMEKLFRPLVVKFLNLK